GRKRARPLDRRSDCAGARRQRGGGRQARRRRGRVDRGRASRTGTYGRAAGDLHSALLAGSHRRLIFLCSTREVDVERHDRERLRMRDVGLRRLKLLTRTLTVGAAALAAVFAGLAAQASSRKAGRASSATARTPANVKPTTRIPAAPSLPELGSNGAAA